MARVGGSAAQQNRLLIFLLFVLFIIFLFYANPLPSSIPPHLNPHNRQVDDCVAGEEEVLIEGGQVDVLAEEMEEDVGVDLSVGVCFQKYEEPGPCGSAGDFLLGDKMSSAILRKQAAKSKVIIKKSRVSIKRYKMEKATSEATICNLEEKVAAFESTLEQLKRSHENAMIDLTTTHRRRVSYIHSWHFSSLSAEKQKLRLRIVDARQLHDACHPYTWW